MGCPQVRTPPEFGVLVVGVPRIESTGAAHTQGYLARKTRPDISHGFRAFVPSNAPQRAVFGLALFAG